MLLMEDTQNNSLPLDEDLVISILLRLPEKSLVRFRCVSKSWLSLITGEWFIRLYLQTNKPSQNSNGSNSFILVGKNTILTYDFSRTQIVSKLPNPPIFLERKSFIGSTNGLICFLHSPRLFALYNPTTQAYRVLPSLKQWRWGNCVIRSYCGFGYDYRSNDFKIVILGLDRDPGCPRVYSLRTNSWEFIKPSNFEFTEYELKRVLGKTSVFSNNGLHWLVSSGILGFNLATDEFYRVPLPGGIRWQEDNDLDLTDLRGCLHLLVLKNFFRPSIGIWVMKKYGVKKSWTKLLHYKSNEVGDLFSIYPSCFYPRLYVYSKDDKEIVLGVDFFQKCFFSCHLQTRKVKKVEDLSNLPEEHGEGFSWMPWTCTFATCD